jgi:hypothetical protein
MDNAIAGHCSTCDAQTPIFLSRKGILTREYYVRVIWPDGHGLRIGKFPLKDDANNWIRTESAAWLAGRTVQPGPDRMSREELLAARATVSLQVERLSPRGHGGKKSGNPKRALRVKLRTILQEINTELAEADSNT